MKKLLLTIIASAIGLMAFAQMSEGFAGKTIAVFTIGNQYDYDANKRTLNPSGGEGTLIAKSNCELITNMISWYGGKVINPQSRESVILRQEMNKMNGDADFSVLRTRAKELSIDYVLWEDLEWMMYRDQLFIYEYQIKLLDVAKNVIDRKSSCFYMNAQKDAHDMEGATARLNNSHVDMLKEITSRVTPRLWAITGASKNGKRVDMLPATFAGYYTNDIFHVYKIGGEQRNLNGLTSSFLTLTPLAKSTKIETKDDNKYIVNLDSKIKLDPSYLISAGNLITSYLPGVNLPFIPIAVESIKGANASSYDNHNKEVTNYALYNAIHKNKMLKVIADSSDAILAPKYTCKLLNYSESKNIVKVQLTITDLEKAAVVKNVVIESHISNLDNVISSHINNIFGTPTALGDIEKKTISYYVQYPIAFQEGEKILLSLDDETRTPVVVYNLLQWQGQKYILEEVDVINKKAARKIGKDGYAKYLLMRYNEPLKDPKKDNSEFKKVAGGINKLLDMVSK